ncbi:MAG TPA: hypothetical protein VL549_12575, partial [Gemmatimonadales bacterium]|nr:hypothetical protein [Gemmatimonadales bacterium]
VAASRVGDGLIVVASKSLLGSAGADPKTRDFLVALARWTRRPAEWASVTAASQPVPLRLANAPQRLGVHPPTLTAPTGAAVTALPLVAGARAEDSVIAPGWVARQGMRVLWARFTPQGLDSLLRFVDVAALNTIATLIPFPALADTIGTRNLWKVTAERLQATSIKWFPAVSLAAVGGASQGADEVDRRGDLVPIACGLDTAFWRGALRPTYRQLVRLGGARPDVLAGVALDLDSAMTEYSGSGFCDADYRVGLAALGLDSIDASRLAALPPIARYDSLLERGLLNRYFDALSAAVAERAGALRGEVRRLNAEVRFAVRATDRPADWFTLGLLRGLSSRDAPVLLWLKGGAAGGESARTLLREYRAREIYALSAHALAPDRATFAPAGLPRLHASVFGENAGFWLDGAASDSLGRAIRRFVR